MRTVGESGHIIWINGSFGVGKTTVAGLLHDHIVGSLLFNPEHIGTILRLTMRGLPTDYQDLPVWRRTVRFIAGQLAIGSTGPVIVPVTIANEQYFDEIVGGLRIDGFTVRHVTLVASSATIRSRMTMRTDATPWAFEQIDRCIAAFDGRERFREYVETDGSPATVVAERVAASVAV